MKDELGDYAYEILTTAVAQMTTSAMESVCRLHVFVREDVTFIPEAWKPEWDQGSEIKIKIISQELHCIHTRTLAV